jgi:FtsZ-binding cell division protein ZapB
MLDQTERLLKASIELAQLRRENKQLKTENALLQERLRFTQLRTLREWRDNDDTPALLRPQGG